jgi:5'-deoxynucleotidase YfbR-like HD superfamily hydrolase
MLMNVTYEYPYRDIVEEEKYIEEHLRYVERVKQMENKFTKDMDLLRMMYNVQNAQIQKLSEIIFVNAALIKQIDTKTLPKPEFP